MKFNKIFKLFVTLTATISVYGESIEDIHERHKRQCRSQLNPYYECNSNFMGKSYSVIRSSCTAFRSDKCQKFFDNPQSVVPACYTSGALGRFGILNDMANDRKLQNFICSATPQNTACPFLDYVTTEDWNKFYPSISENCKYSKCTEGLKDFITILRGSTESQEMYNIYTNVLKYLNSSDCKNGIPYGGVKKTTTTTTKKTTTTTTKKTTTTTTKKTTTTTTIKKTTTTTTTSKKPTTTTTSAPAPVKTTTTPEPAPSETTSAPAPSETTPAPAPSETTSAPAPSETTSAPAPSETTPAPAPSETTSEPAPSETTSAPAPSETTPAPAPSETTTPALAEATPAPFKASPKKKCVVRKTAKVVKKKKN